MSKRVLPEDAAAAGGPAAKQQALEVPKQQATRGGAVAKPPVVVYKDTEPLHNIQNYYRSGAGNRMLEVLIPPELMSKDNKRVKARQIWGDLVYSPDTDLVAALMHLGYYAPNLSAPPASVVEFRALIKLLPPRGVYPSKARFLKSREYLGDAEKPEESCSYQVERVWLVTRGAAFVDLPPCIDDLPAASATVQPQSSDRQINTRHTGTARSKHAQEASVQFNLCNEPWLKYSLAAIADKGMKPAQLTSARLLSSVLYMETHGKRYQLALQSLGGDTGKDLFSFARCKSALPSGMMAKLGAPLPAEQVEVLAEGVEWEEFKWAISSLHLRDKEYPLRRLHFVPLTKTADGKPADGKAADGAA